jgi:hypothetical protein
LKEKQRDVRACVHGMENISNVCIDMKDFSLYHLGLALFMSYRILFEKISPYVCLHISINDENIYSFFRDWGWNSRVKKFTSAAFFSSHPKEIFIKHLRLFILIETSLMVVCFWRRIWKRKENQQIVYRSTWEGLR